MPSEPIDLLQPDLILGALRVRTQLSQIMRDETAHHVEARSMQVLLCLASKAPEIVSKRAIMDEVWGDTFVGEEVVSHCIWDLRKALGDDAKAPEYIETIPRRGYRLIQEVVRVPVDTAEPTAGARINQYQLKEQLGQGSTGVVYRAIDADLGREVALKFLAPELTRDPTARERFKREARLAARLDHPNIATVYGTGISSDNRLFIATAYYKGGSLKSRLANGRMSPDEAVSIALQIASGLAEAHQNRIVHRDIKPANILLTEDGTAKIGDFGIAKLVSGTRLTLTGTALGTPAYKSPEQSRGKPVDHRSDLWSLGVLLYEMLSGRKPFAGEYEYAVVHSILSEQPTPLEGIADLSVPRALNQVVERALAKDPSVRYQNAEDLTADLEAIGQPSSPAAAARSRGRSWIGRIALTLLFLLLATSAFELLRRQVRNERVLEAVVDEVVTEGWRAELAADNRDELELARAVYEDGMVVGREHPRFLAAYALLRTQLPSAAENLACVDAEADCVDRWVRLANESGASSGSMTARARALVLEDKLEQAERTARRAVELATPRGSREASASVPSIDSERGRDCDLASDSPCQLYVARTGLAAVLTARGRLAEARSVLDSVHENVPGYVQACMGTAYAFWIAGRNDVAGTLYNRALRFRPNHEKALHSLGAVYTASGRYGDALPKQMKVYRMHLERGVLVSDRPAFALLVSNIGTTRFFLGDAEGAREKYLEAIEIDDELADGWAGLGDTHKVLGNPGQAEVAWREAVARFDREPEIEGQDTAERRAHRALYVAWLGGHSEALEEIQESLAEAPSNWQISLFAAQVYAILGDKPRVLEILRQAVAGKGSVTPFRIDPSFEAIRADPEFEALLGVGGERSAAL